MNKQYQVTLMCNDGKYKPVSCIITCEELNLNHKEVKKNLVQKGIKKICAKRYWTNIDLKKYGYTKVKVREYDKIKIEAEAKAKYDAIKEAHYKDGSWKRPKEKS